MRINIPLTCVLLIPLSFAAASDQPTPSFAEETGYGRINFLNTLELARGVGSR